MQVERYRIVLTGWVMSGHQTREVIAELSCLFKIPEDRIRPLLVGASSIIRRDLTLEKAEYLRNKIEKRGAVCSIKRVMRDDVELGPYSLDSIGIMEPDLNVDSTQFVLTEECQDTAAPSPPHMVARKSKNSQKRRKGLSIAAVVLLAGVLLSAAVLGYFQLYPDRFNSEMASSVFTFPPAKGGVTVGEK